MVIRFIISISAVFILYTGVCNASEVLSKYKIQQIELHTAKIIKHVIRNKTDQPNMKCRFLSEWGNNEIDFSTARRYFGIKIYANISAPQITMDLGKLLTYLNAPEGSICTEAQSKNIWETNKDAFVNHRNDPQIIYMDGTNSLKWLQAEISRPIFDDNFSTALFKITYTTVGLARRGLSDPPPKKGFGRLLGRDIITGSTHIYVYKNRNGTWHNINVTESASFDGIR